jgi:hypothetical protein
VCIQLVVVPDNTFFTSFVISSILSVSIYSVCHCLISVYVSVSPYSLVIFCYSVHYGVCDYHYTLFVQVFIFHSSVYSPVFIISVSIPFLSFFMKSFSYSVYFFSFSHFFLVSSFLHTLGKLSFLVFRFWSLFVFLLCIYPIIVVLHESISFFIHL